jgi:hypothetical protein
MLLNIDTNLTGVPISRCYGNEHFAIANQACLPLDHTDHAFSHEIHSSNRHKGGYLFICDTIFFYR